ncbi:MAG: GNAT family N-acetyltransferase [Candidatus Obscuribacterales bacterium]|nr:GNAT family N-acetyltransferase [Candidatus Obscuribacterales bacterium]
MPSQLVCESVSDRIIAPNDLLNVVEPPHLVDIFLNNPPVGFESLQVPFEDSLTPAFRADFDLLTTLEDDAAKIRTWLHKFPFLKCFHTFSTIFVGTTATEYSNYANRDDFLGIISALKREMVSRNSQFVIVKDIPQQSPLLSDEENRKAEMLLRQCVEQGFQSVDGQALAYVPIDFKSVDEFLMRMSKSRRKEFRKKLKDSAHVQVSELSCGDKEFFEQSFLDLLYQMYEHVYEQSEVHFDVLTKGFFKDLLQSKTGGGKVFCYKVDGRLIGYNICFVHNKTLVDKYVGFIYPDARNANLYFLSWFYNLEYAIKNGLSTYIAGWTDPAVKASLGAKFTLTRHAVFIRNPILRAFLASIKNVFESDSKWVASREKDE